jgi:hypothetical protein
MIQFNELRITPDANYLIIEAEIKSDSYFENVSLYCLQIIKVTDEKGNTEPVLEDYFNESTKAIEIAKEEDKIKKVRYKLNAGDLNNINFTDSFLKVVISSTGDATSPEGYANNDISSPVLNLYPFYVHTISNIKNLDTTCYTNTALIDCILRFKALELALKTGDEHLAAQYWFKYFKPLSNKGRSFINNDCYV